MLTEREIQAYLFRRNRQRFMVLMPNYTPRGWWECDLFGVTKAGYFHEFEIKLTLADFRRDKEKSRRPVRRWENGQFVKVPGQQKHSLMGQGVGPARYWFVVPDSLDVLAELPEWAGLQVIHPAACYVRVVKPAPQLHRVKIADSIVRHAQGVCYYRYWHERQALDALQRTATREGASA